MGLLPDGNNEKWLSATVFAEREDVSEVIRLWYVLPTPHDRNQVTGASNT